MNYSNLSTFAFLLKTVKAVTRKSSYYGADGKPRARKTQYEHARKTKKATNRKNPTRDYTQ
jgi:hypothetical protein